MAVSRLNDPTVYGHRAKIGVIVPPTNSANEAEWWHMAPPGVSIHSARMPLHTDTQSDAGQAALLTDIEHYCQALAQVGPDVVVYGCTAGSMTSPPSALANAMQDFCGLPAITTAQSIVEALRALDVATVSVGTPYHDALNHHEVAFLEAEGFRVTAIEGLGYGANGPAEYRNIARIPVETVRSLAQRVDRPAAEAILLSCTDMATAGLIQALEAELGKPVISSNSATFWYALRTAGLDDRLDGFGQLFSRH